MTQLRLNSLTVCHVHHELLDLVDVNALIEEVLRNDTRVSMFGTTQSKNLSARRTVFDIFDFTNAVTLKKTG